MRLPVLLTLLSAAQALPAAPRRCTFDCSGTFPFSSHNNTSNKIVVGRRAPEPEANNKVGEGGPNIVGQAGNTGAVATEDSKGRRSHDMWYNLTGEGGGVATEDGGGS